MSETRRILVAYYSRTGFTARLGDEMACELGADVERLIDTRDRSGMRGFVTAGRDAFRGHDVPCEPIKADVADYDLVVIGTPVWANTMATAVRSFLGACGGEIAEAAFFCSTHRSGIDSTFQKMADLLGKPPVATSGFLEKKIKRDEYREQLERFVRELRGRP